MEIGGSTAVRDDHPLIPTYTGKRIDPMRLDPDDICIEDIAHHLSLLNRFTGATDEAYSVAQHCLVVSAYAPPVLKLPALLHDAPEAYMGDLTHPLKHHSLMGQMFRNIEQVNEIKIEAALGLEAGSLSHPGVKSVDEEVFEMEWAFFIQKRPRATPFVSMDAKRAERMFLIAYDALKVRGDAIENLMRASQLPSGRWW
jgi:hypothetical protein